MSPLRTGRALRSRFTLARWVARKSPIRTLVCTLRSRFTLARWVARKSPIGTLVRTLGSRFTLARWVARKSPIRTLVCTLGRRRRGSSRRGPRRRVRSRTAVTFQSSTLADGVADTDITLWQHSMVVAHGIILILALPGIEVERLALVVLSFHDILHVIGVFAFPCEILV